MVKTVEEMRDLTRDRLAPLLKMEREKFRELEAWTRGGHDTPYSPPEVNNEYRELLEKSRVPLLGLVVNILVQSLEITDFTPGVEATREPLWNFWNINRMRERQRRLWRAALTGGIGYAMVLPGTTAPVIKLFSSSQMTTVFGDPEYDEFAEYAVYVEKYNEQYSWLHVLDSEARWTFKIRNVGENDFSTNEIEYADYAAHSLGVCPVIHFRGDVDTEGRSYGEIEKLIPIQRAVDQTKFDLLMAQTFSSFQIRYVTGMEAPRNEMDKIAAKLKIARDRVLVSDSPDAKFGTLAGDDLQGYIEASKASKQEMSTVAQIPHKYIVGVQANSSNGAEAQSADEALMMRKIHDFTRSYGESAEQLFRLLGRAGNISDAINDYSSQVSWRDSAIRSLAQIADAVQKLSADSLGIPKKSLWGMIPGITPEELKKWEENASQEPEHMMARALGYVE